MLTLREEHRGIKITTGES